VVDNNFTPISCFGNETKLSDKRHIGLARVEDMEEVSTNSHPIF